MLAAFGLDIYRKAPGGKAHCTIPTDRLAVLMLDDCQRQFKNVPFSVALLKNSASLLPQHVRIVLSATHLLEDANPASPVEFGNVVARLTLEEFLISDDESKAFLEKENGLHKNMQYSTLMEILIRECKGHIGALRCAIDSLSYHFSKSSPTLAEVLQFYFSSTFLGYMSRCYGSKHTSPTIPALQQFLIKCLVRDPTAGPIYLQQLSQEDESYLKRLTKAGIVTTDRGGFVRFMTPMSERYYTQWLFPYRAAGNPTSLQELVRKALSSMSASMLRQSVASARDLPKEATFQHLFLTGLAHHTSASCFICHELSKVFPAEPNELTNGQMDFHLNGDLRWGIELLVDGKGIGEHMRRFAPGGKYAALGAAQYVVVDLRGNESGRVTDVVREEHRISVFYKLGDFSSCRCIFGMEEDPRPIVLEN
ncbi:hypothetical protein Poli38472_007763 [Pythium oligandrum]|uniref:Uncharacterized protein n=1 Tax=Pythium oligandrum TaxID=41045 RepID=A0A8K1CQQ9_PYTOL|nr:hypothetical protein Poli38472_007763 [Pythium oligandrum]|eukprot:TMW68091.1 hypothetical protein Poli38472_007763 [Pythium oligandrum]